MIYIYTHTHIYIYIQYRNLAALLAKGEGGGRPFFGGGRPHMGDFGVWKQADMFATLEPTVHTQLGAEWVRTLVTRMLPIAVMPCQRAQQQCDPMRDSSS